MRVLHSQWRDSRIVSYPLENLTPADPHADCRYLTRDLPRIQQSGLWYPLLLYQADPTWWYSTKQGQAPTLLPWQPVINSDGCIWAVKMGSNRYQCAVFLGYDAIDCIMCSDANQAVKLGRWYAQCDPLNNPNALPYQDLFDYEHLLT